MTAKDAKDASKIMSALLEAYALGAKHTENPLVDEMRALSERLAAMEKERDELREAVLTLGQVADISDEGDIVVRAHLRPDKAITWNRLVAKLRAGVKP